jgi:hypothetical protein
MRFQTPTLKEEPIKRIEPFAGLNNSVTPSLINDKESPDMMNVSIDIRGSLNKRTGYERNFNNTLGTGSITGIFHYVKPDGTSDLLFSYKNKLLKQSYKDEFLGTAEAIWLDDDLTIPFENLDVSFENEINQPKPTPVELFSSMSGRDVTFFLMNNLCYILDGGNYLVYDGTEIKDVPAYIPTVSISKTPLGGGTPFEDFNMIGGGFKDSFSGNGTDKVFQLTFSGIDADTVKAVVDNVDKVEGTDFTVNRTSGRVTFTDAPPAGTNNVIITAFKAKQSLRDKVIKCNMSVLFGGDNDTRVVISGHPTLKNYVFASGVYDPTYFPENRFYKVGADSDPVQGFVKQYDYLVIEKQRSKWTMGFSLNNEGVPTYPIRPINDRVGTIAKKSIEVIDNNAISLSRTGVYMLVASNVRDEKNVVHISQPIDNKLLAEPYLENAVSIDYDRKYWLAVNGNVYVYDYTLKVWYTFNNIYASCFLEVADRLFFGTFDNGLIHKFKKDNDTNAYNDDGKAINAYWTSKHFTFEADELKKMIEKVFFSLKPAARSSVDLYYVTNKKYSNLVKSIRTFGTFDFRAMDFSAFTFNTSVFPRESSAKIKAKKITHFQVVFKNDRLNESMGITSTGIKFKYQNYVK